MRLQTMLVLMAPFVLVALFHSHRLTGALTSGLSGGGRPRLSLIGAGRLATAMARRGLIAGPSFDLSASPWCDLLDNGFLDFLFFLGQPAD